MRSDAVRMRVARGSASSRRTLAAGLAASLACAACSDPDRERLKQTTRATYDQTTGRLKELTLDANKNGRIDTWTDMDGTRPLRSGIDRVEDGKLDRWEYYDDKGQLAKIGFSRANDGTPDAGAFSVPTARWCGSRCRRCATSRRSIAGSRYDPAGADGMGALIAAEEDVNKDGKPDKWETDERSTLTSAALDENYDGRTDRRLTCEAGALATIESEPDAAGRYTRQVRVK